MKLKLTILFILLSIVGIELYVYNGVKSSNLERSKDLTDILKEKRYWVSRINTIGPVEAYKEFKRDYKNEEHNTAHKAAHIFGELLFLKAGNEGFSLCDDTFGYGCYHSFLTRAIATQGSGVIHSLYEACLDRYTKETSTGCEHGLGHGLLEYVSPNRLTAALKECITVQYFQLVGCTSGVFMEYDFPAFITSTQPTFSLRLMNDDNMFSPCDTIPEIFKKSCFLERPKWWNAHMPKKYDTMVQLCSKIENPEYTDVCIMGIGATIVEKNWNVAEAIQVCESMPTNRIQLLCKSGASWGFFEIPEYRHLASSICNTMSAEENIECEKIAALTKYPKWDTN